MKVFKTDNGSRSLHSHHIVLIPAKIDFEAVYGHVDHSLDTAVYNPASDGRIPDEKVNEMFSKLGNVYAIYPRID